MSQLTANGFWRRPDDHQALATSLECLRIALLGLLISLTVNRASATQGQQTEHAHGYTLNLLEDDDLSLWESSGCHVELNDGVLRVLEGDGFVRTLQEFQDFILELDYRASAESDSGIFVRAPKLTEDHPWTEEFEIDLKLDSSARTDGAQHREGSSLLNPGEWNRIQVAAIGKKLTLTINGTTAWAVDDVERSHGYVGFQATRMTTEEIEFRNISIRELNSRSLFNGVDLSGWEANQSSAEPCWTVEQGVLLCTGKAGSWLRSESTWADFNLRLEYRLLPAGNSGVYIRVPRDGKHHGARSGVEVQVLDDQHEKYRKLKPDQYSGSLYAVAAATHRPGRDPGQWNQLEINCQGFHYRVCLNGVTVIQTDGDATPELKQRRGKGFIGLQNHREVVEFRRIRIGPPLPIGSD